MRWKFNPWVLLVCILVNALNIAWWIFYILGSIDPNPHSIGVIGIFPLRTLIILGFWSIPFNMFPAVWYIKNMRAYLKHIGRPSREKRTFDVNPWIIYPFWMTIFILPLALFLAAYGAAFQSWNHRCSSYPLYAIFSATKTHDITTSHPIVQFYQTREKSPLFTYNLTGNLKSGSWEFNFDSWDAEQSHIPPEFYPTIQNISYNSTSGILQGNCMYQMGSTDPSEAVPCLDGTFNQNDFLTLDLSSSASLSSTNNTIFLRSSSKQWNFGVTAAPYVILRALNSFSQLLDSVVLRTAVPNPQDCTQLKVCLDPSASSGVGGSGEGVGESILAPLGIILLSQTRYAVSCIDFAEAT